MSQLKVNNEILKAQKADATLQVSKLAAKVLRKEVDVVQKEMDAGMSEMLSRTRNLPPWLAPGNVGDINLVYWPFFFTTPLIQVAQNSQATGSFSVTRAASFVMTKLVKTVYQRTAVPPGPDTYNYEYLDPNQGAAGYAPGLGFSWRDASSSRLFVDRTIALDHVGNPRFPWTLDSPQFFYPNSTVEYLFTNSGPQDYYVRIAVQGVRVRVDGQDSILSTVSE